ncbi:hypothetical protein RR46_06980 [Papilio xuthus]|uniref:F-box domain-containing protein n=1 Tax=Papilio xuthus TaxID=66420 RepID=A0A194Q5V7_PAPXU|nr:hypothetical protein RR46_06980 [Papilio xuthus]
METLQMGEELSGDVDDNNIKDENKDSQLYNGYENGNFTIQLLDFSDDVLLIILRNLSPRDLKALGFTCMRFASLVLERSLWRKVDARGQPCGTARFKWLLNAIHDDTKSLMLTGYAGQNDGCWGHYVPKPGEEEPKDGTVVEPAVPRIHEMQFCARNRYRRQHALFHIQARQLPRVVSTPSWPDEPRNEAWELVAEDFIPAEKDQKPGKCTGPRFTFTGSMYFKLIDKCPKLTTLVLEYCNINCRTSQILVSPNQELDLRGCPVGDSEVSSLSWLPELRVLQLASHRPASAPGHRHHRLAKAPSAVSLQQWEIEEPDFFKKHIVERDTDLERKDCNDPFTFTDSDSDDTATDENCTAYLTKKRQEKEKKTKKRKQEDGSGDADVNKDVPSCSKSRKTDETKDGDKKKDKSKKDSDSEDSAGAVENGSYEGSKEHKVNGKKKSKRIEDRDKKESENEVNDGASTSWERSRHVRGFICLRRNRDPEEDENPIHRALYVNFNTPNVEPRPNFPSVFSDQITFLNPTGRLQTVALVTDTSVRQFGRADGENITYVNFGPNGPVRFEGVSPARPARSNLRSLSMVGYTNITDRSLVHLATAAPFLEFVDFRGTRVTAEGVQQFLLERPDCKGGEDVQAGSVLLPATRRGRYLANIVRRQAVDGTGIKFNKDADRINAEAKKKVDVLSEELLPYIIAEQERRTTLYRRIMTAIQNGEKGVTIAEIRNKPPLIIRKGLMYRCPANRAPKEPDGTGVLMCEDEIEPAQVMYDSCLSAEDKDLYVAENKYFFCNRHKIEGPDLPRNGSTVIGCAPIERTSLNYTSAKCALEDTDDVVVHYRYYPDRIEGPDLPRNGSTVIGCAPIERTSLNYTSAKCALEDTDDVVVHYRYYPDRTYKFVTELDPDHEVCDHWNPCQIGYIYSLPSPDQAVLANELWQDSLEEWVPPTARNYTSSPRKIIIPDGYEFHRIKHSSLLRNSGTSVLPTKYYTADVSGNTVTVTLNFPTWSSTHVGPFFASFIKPGTKREKVLKFLTLSPSGMTITPKSIELLHGQRVNSTVVPFKCNRCRLLNLMVRASDGNVYNVDNSRHRVKEFIDREGKPRQFLEIDLEGMKPQDFGDYFLVIQNGDGLEERVKGLTVLLIDCPRLTASFEVGGHFDRTMQYTCDDCQITDILCNGESVLAAGRVSIIRVSKMISFNFPRYEDNHSCVYMGFFKSKDKVFKKILAVIDSVTVQFQTVAPPPLGQQFEQEITYVCDDCTVSKATSTSIKIRITEYATTYEGVYQAVFMLGSDEVTKSIMEIKDPNVKSSGALTTAGSAASEVTTGKFN